MMKKIFINLNTLAITAWVGSLWGIGYLAVPILFKAQPDRQLAGMLAGEMFTWVGYLGLVCGAYLLLSHFGKFKRQVICQKIFWVVLTMLLITLLLLCGIQPAMTELKAQALPLAVTDSDLYGRFKMLHGVSSIAYLIESLLGAYLVIKVRRT
jgi:hypothetical protein